ncbi:MAG: 1-(5-phosphoribosyl)-5-amino-4-imidazole-carboxylate carboxylase, partial [Candidatus Rokubacteria bacterium]|nr:1-(5-phosphoribosyl)-5-amino-4-imidazole-carboxylate carboxylase [Candidatus Rokubacteria bacterium]
MMDVERLRGLLDEVRQGRLTVEAALERLKGLPFADLGFARVDLHRALRTGAPEAVFCQGKTPEQVVAILRRLATDHANVLATRAGAEVHAAVEASGVPCRYYPEARIVVANPRPQDGVGLIVVVSAGTADLPVAEEAAVTAEVLGNRVERIYDAGVAGLHRLLAQHPLLGEANV